MSILLRNPWIVLFLFTSVAFYFNKFMSACMYVCHFVFMPSIFRRNFEINTTSQPTCMPACTHMRNEKHVLYSLIACTIPRIFVSLLFSYENVIAIVNPEKKKIQNQEKEDFNVLLQEVLNEIATLYYCIWWYMLG